MHSLKALIQRRPWLTAVLVMIFIIASCFRLWRLNETFHFMGDQGRDALIVSRIFIQQDLVFIGPMMSVGNIYLGPFYYYFMLPFLWLSYPSPVGPVYAVALANIATVLLLFFLGKKLVGERGALFASAMMAVSAIAITHSRFSWNPNIIPLVSLLMVIASYFAIKRNPKYWIAVAACLGIIIQLHYVTLLSGIAAFLLLVLQLFTHRKDTKVIKNILMSLGMGAVVFVALLSPLILFDIQHNWLNFRALQSLATDEKNFVQASSTFADELVTISKNLQERSSLILWDKVIGYHKVINSILVLAVVCISAYYLRFSKYTKNTERTGLLVLWTYLLVGIVGFSFYEKDMYDHYIAYLLPLAFLAIGFSLDAVVKKNIVGWIVVIVFGIAFLKYNIPLIEFKVGGPSQADLIVTAESIHSRVSDNEPYAIVLLSESKDSYGMNYRYYLNVNQLKRPVDPEFNGAAQKLFIINEERATDRPQDAEIYEIVTFGTTKPTEVYTLPQGVTVSVLDKNRTLTP